MENNTWKGINWTRLIDNTIEFEVLTKVLPTKGNLVYEYNPFRNYRLNQTMFEYKGEYYTKELLKDNFGIEYLEAVEAQNAVYTFESYNNSSKEIKYGEGTVEVIELRQDGATVKVLTNTDLGNSGVDFVGQSFKVYSLDETAVLHLFSTQGEPQPIWVTVTKISDAVVASSDKWIKNDSDISDSITLHEKGELVDFITEELSFSINHPVNITPQYSYDGSVNLILNDGVNIPRMINSRFSATGKNTYEIVDRKGNNDTNIYDLGEQFDIDTSLYKRIVKIPKIHFKGVQSGGNLKVGNYHFYFKLADADGNETDFVGESGLVSIFIGFNTHSSIHSGVENENSYKSTLFQLSNIDTAYDHVCVYYSRYTAAGGEEFNIEYIKIDKKYLIANAGISNILITGFEKTINLSASDINLSYNVIDSAKALTTCLNMLFLGNVHKPDIPYKELSDLSLRFLPYLQEETYNVDIDKEYMISTYEKGYIDPEFIYNKTGYWGEEIYRLGIVYIMPNNELSPVFNIRGANNIKRFGEYQENGLNIPYIGKYNDGQFSNIPIYTGNEENKERNYIQYNENDNIIFPIITNNENNSQERPSILGLRENVKGVVRFKPTKDTKTIYGIDIRVDNDTILELKKYVKGYFFVRQTRIPTILAQGVTIGVDKFSHTPCIATADGYLNNFKNANYTHIVSKDINDVNYITEGFLNRFLFEFKKKSSGLFGSILKGIAIGVGVVALAAAVVFTYGAAGAAIAAGATVTSTIAGGMAAVSTTLGVVAGAVGVVGVNAIVATAVTAGVVAVGTAATIATLGATQEIRYALQRAFSKIELNGRATECPSGYYVEELSKSRKLTQDFRDRLIIVDPSRVNVQGILCPDYEVDLGYYNSIFTGNKHTIGLTNTLCTNGLSGHSSNYFTNDDRHFYIPSYYDMGIRNMYDFKIVGVPSDVSLTGIDKLKFRSRAGYAEQAYTYELVGGKYEGEWGGFLEKKINSDIVRGSFGAYLAFNDTNNKFSPAETVNIYIPEYSLTNMDKYFEIRMLDTTPFYAISERYTINDIDNDLITKATALEFDLNNGRNDGYHFILYRGDCYICQFTHRMHWNFQDPGAPFNDEIVLDDTWRENYDPEEPEKYNMINSGDINAVQIGTWVTFTIRSSKNLNIRTLDGSDVTLTAMTGHPKGFYPYNDMRVLGNYKHSDSEVYNRGFMKSVSERFNKELPDVPHIKNWFGTRIMYSDIYINDAYKNSFRVFKPTTYRDYTREYGEIVKLVTLESDIICIFEHGVVRLPINREQVVKLTQAGNNQVTSFNVLPEAPTVLSDMFGSQWADSVLKTPGKHGNSKQYIYGVDTVAKKIWRTDGVSLECISDFKVQEFLNNNITLGERENTPILGIRNVKTVYNAYKRDVMFTFYDNTYGFEEKVWNLCWNELLERFITFYSWVPSFMENINNVPFSFDRNVSKWIAKLGVSHAENSFADGITLTNTVINNYLNNDRFVDNFSFNFTYKTKTGETKTITYTIGDVSGSFYYPEDDYINPDLSDLNYRTRPPKDYLENFIGVLGISNRILPENLFYTIDYELERDPWYNYKNFRIIKIGDIILSNISDSIYYKKTVSTKVDDKNYTYPVYGLYFDYSAPEDSISYIYTDIDLEHIVSADVKDKNTNIISRKPVHLLKVKADPEVLMSELYYRNSAGHAYADYDINKVKYTVNNSMESLEYADPDNFDYKKPLDPETIYNIDLVMQYVAYNWYKNNDGILPSVSENSSDSNSKGESLLTRSGGPFEYDTVVYLNGSRGYYVCSGGLGDLIDRGYKHAPFDAHFMYGKYIEQLTGKRVEIEDLPIFKDITGKRPMLPKDEQLNPDKIVTLLNIRANVKVLDAYNENNLSDSYYNMKAPLNKGTSLINVAQYESVIGITTKWNLQFLTSDFWKHGQAGLIDIADEIYPTYWYGKQHPFEFECVVVDDPSLHKIFTNLELVANKAKPESFHYEVVGETYDFAKDKVNMYFRQEAMKALWLYNGADIMYDRNFLKVQPKQQPRSADFVHRYYTRLDTINEIEDYYIHVSYPSGYDYRHLSGAEIVYYPTRQEFRVWNHAMAVSMDDLSLDDARSIISTNCKYLEDRWKVTINPIIVCYKNEYRKLPESTTPLIHPDNTTWARAYDSDLRLPLLPIMNSPIPDKVLYQGLIAFPGISKDASGVSETNLDRSNALYHLYDLSNFGITDFSPLDTKSWLNDLNIYKYNFGEAHNRKEVDVRDKFVKIRIRYTGEELAVIDFLNTIYLVSYA